MYPGKCFRGRKAVRSAVVAFALASLVDIDLSVADTTWINTATTGTWNLATNWSAGVPQQGGDGDIFRNVNVTYNITVPVDYQAVQLAGATTGGIAELTLSTGTGTPAFQATNLILGGSYATNPYGNTLPEGTGSGEVAQSAGTIAIDATGILEVDPVSSFILSGSGTVNAYNQLLSGTFSQSGNTLNNLSTGSILTNNGTYTLAGGTVSADAINNAVYSNGSTGVNTAGIFNQTSGTLQGNTSTNFNFNNSAAYIYSGGTFLGVMNNNVGATININAASIPFTLGLLNNGRMTVTGGTGSFSGSISGTGSLIFNGATSITLTGTGTFMGQTTITAGTVIVAGPVAANGAGGTIDGNVGISAAGTLQTNSDSQLAFNALVSINGGTFNLNTHDEIIGTLNMTAGHVVQASGQGLGVTSGNIYINNGSSSITGGLRSSVPINFNVLSSANLSVGGNISGYNSMAGSVVLTGGGGLSISANSILSSIDVQQGILQISEGGAFAGINPTVNVEGAGSMSIGSQVVAIGNLIGTGAVSLGTGALSITTNSSGGTFAGSINGAGTLTKFGTSTLTLTGNDSSTGMTNVSQGTLTVASSGSISSTVNVAAGSTAHLNGTLNNTPNINAIGTVNFGANPGTGIFVTSISALTLGSNATAGNGQVNLLPASVHANRTLLVAAGVTLNGVTGAWTSQLDLANNDLVVHYGSLTALTNQIKSGFANGSWNGAGIVSSSAVVDSSHLTALGVIQNDDGTGTPLYGTTSSLGLFDGIAPSATDVLVKFTYYGDANLDGKVDASDYSRIDSSFISQTVNSPATGWYNGDFNYDGVVNGSDYTLIDNAFNIQGGNLSTSAEISPAAQVTSEIAGSSSVPEPTSIVAVLSLGIAILGRRRSWKSDLQ